MSRRFDDMRPAQQAGILCNDPRFQKFAARRLGLPTDALTATASAEYLRTVCRIKSRSDLDTTAPANARFQILRTEFDAWIGRISRPDASRQTH